MFDWFKQNESMPMLGFTPESAQKYFEAGCARWEPHVRASGAVGN